MGRRVESVEGGVTTRYLYDGMLPILELNSANSASRFITRGLDLSGSREGAGGIGGILATKAGSTTGFYFYDGNGNVVDVIDSSDSVIAHYQYDPFGNKVTSTGSYASQPYQWSTKEFSSSTDLVYYLFRFYNPNNGRWLNRDPIGEEGGVNLYGIASNNAVNQTDTWGLEFIWTSRWDTPQNIFAQFHVWAYTGNPDSSGLALPEVQDGEDEIKEDSSRCSATVTKARQINVRVLTVGPIDPDGFKFTTAGIYAAVEHEKRRGVVYRTAYNHFIAPIDTGGAIATRCGTVTREQPGAAKAELLSYLQANRNIANQEYYKWVDDVQRRIGGEKKHYKRQGRSMLIDGIDDGSFGKYPPRVIWKSCPESE